MSETPAPTSTAADDAPPDCGPRYVLSERLGAGATSTVWQALDKQTNTLVAIKCIYPHFVGNRGSRDLLDRELGIARAVQHPGLVRTLDSGATPAGGHFIVMELLRGVTLQDKLHEGITIDAGLALIDDILPPLAALHAAGVVHRDLKPSNIFIMEDGRIKVIDLGIAKADAIDASVTATGTTLGTPIYMSPEQAVSPKKVVPASDVWSMGIILYELVTGRAPFEGDVAYDIVLRVCTEVHVPASLAAPDIDPRLAALIDRCLDKLPGNRPQDAGQLAHELQSLKSAVAPVRYNTDVNSRPPPPAPAPESASAMGDPVAFAPTLISKNESSFWPWAVLAVILVLVGVAAWMLNATQADTVTLIESVEPLAGDRSAAIETSVAAETPTDAPDAGLAVEAADVTVAEPDNAPAQAAPVAAKDARKPKRRRRAAPVTSAAKTDASAGQPTPAITSRAPEAPDAAPKTSAVDARPDAGPSAAVVAVEVEPPATEAASEEVEAPDVQAPVSADAGVKPSPAAKPKSEEPPPAKPKPDPEPKAEEPAPFITF